MAKGLSSQPDPILFVADGIEYSIRENVTIHEDEVSNAPINLLFAISYFNDRPSPLVPVRGSATISVLVYATKRIVNNVLYFQWEVDIADIVTAYAKRLYAVTDIRGYATVQLTQINGESTDMDEDPHICLYGSSCGLNFDVELQADTHPFLLARGNARESLHFYRSELKAMVFLFAIKPSPYNALYFATDEREKLDEGLYLIDDCDKILCLRFQDIEEDDITGANAIFLHLEDSSQSVPDRMFAISIQDDPVVDESYLIRWTNSMGAPEALLFTGELREVSEIEKPDVYIQTQSYRSTVRKQQRGTEIIKYTLQTGYMTAERIVSLHDMLASEDVELLINGEWVPVIVTSDVNHAVHQREPESFELTIEVLKQMKYRSRGRNVAALPNSRAYLLQDNDGNIILDNDSNTIQENG